MQTPSELDPPMADGYTQMPIGVLRAAYISIGARLLFALIRSYAWNDGYTDATLDRFSRDLGKGGSVRNVKRWMTDLERAGFIYRERRRRPKGETWEATRTWLLVDVVQGQVVRRGPPTAHGSEEPQATDGPWVRETPGQSQGPPVAHNIDAPASIACRDAEAPSELPWFQRSVAPAQGPRLGLPMSVDSLAKASRPQDGNASMHGEAEPDRASLIPRPMHCARGHTPPCHCDNPEEKQ